MSLPRLLPAGGDVASVDLDEVLRAGDHVVLFGAPASLTQAAERLQGP